ncbi:MAG: HAD family hydrolase [candidate division KSB1 bacterium]|nr:HAD family hydrolase [candidate division KSB1 bacterium]MDZ7305057.1 HAD family hydrolase [candidate division KSB1 bacterium]MDZ7313824.1 HAD family hydrolase [candidate division KSB1 bacterium]
MKILLFDIDGTLVHTGGSGKHAMEVAFEEVYGIPNGLENVLLAGQTDPKILLDAFKIHGLSWNDEQVERFKQRYFIHLAEDMKRPRAKRRIMPGFPRLLEELRQQRGIHIGLLTGNWVRGAEIKLDHFGLWKYFEFGAFGDDEVDRNKLVPHALRRAEKKFNIRPNHDAVYVIGDTPRDIQCARPHGAVAIAVATGEYSVEELRVEKPDFLFKDFGEVEKVVKIFQ